MSKKPSNVDWVQLMLVDWGALNRNLANIDITEEECAQLLEAEKRGNQRIMFMLRIYGKYNKLRCRRERLELITLAAEKK